MDGDGRDASSLETGIDYPFWITAPEKCLFYERIGSLARALLCLESYALTHCASTNLLAVLPTLAIIDTLRVLPALAANRCQLFSAFSHFIQVSINVCLRRGDHLA